MLTRSTIAAVRDRITTTLTRIGHIRTAIRDSRGKSDRVAWHLQFHEWVGVLSGFATYILTLRVFRESGETLTGNQYALLAVLALGGYAVAKTIIRSLAERVETERLLEQIVDIQTRLTETTGDIGRFGFQRGVTPARSVQLGLPA